MNAIDFSQFKTVKELQDFCSKLFRMNMDLQIEVKGLQEKVSHAESLLNNIPQNAFAIENPEIEICKIEIKRLYDIALRQPLSDGELRNLEILCRTLLALKGKAVVNENEKAKKKKENLDMAKVIALAKQAVDGQ